MMTELNQHELLNRYLLGAASSEECAVVEEQYFGSDTGVDLLLRAEDELIDDYVRGALSASDRRLFESHFLCTAGRRERLRAVRSFVEVLAQPEYVDSTVSSARQKQTLREDQFFLTGFTALLNWLDSDQQKAAEKYETIRRRLITIFASRGFQNAEDLADETFDRVVAKMAQLAETYVGDPARYFLGVARNLMLEQARPEARPLNAAIESGEGVLSETYHDCLEECVRNLSESDRDLIFLEENKVDRNAVAQSLEISTQELRLRAHRIRHYLKNCIKACLQNKKTLSKRT